MIEWCVTYSERGKIKKVCALSKKVMVHEYLNLLDRPLTDGISGLKIYKGQTDYTATLNRFLAN